MKNSLRVFVVVFLVSLLLSKSNEALGIVHFSGKILNKASDSISISFNTNRLAYYPDEYFMLVDSKGSFSVSFPVPANVYIQAEIKHGIHLSEVLLHDGDSLFLSADASRFDSSIQYSGRGAGIQNFVVKHILARGRINQYSVRMKNSMGLDPALFIAAIDREKAEEISFLEKNKKLLPQPFLKYWNAQFTYYNYFFIQQYPQMHEVVRLNRYTDTIPSENYSVLKDMPAVFDDELLQVPTYLLYLSGFFESRLKATGYGYPLTNPSNAAMFLDSVNTLAYNMLPDKSAAYFIAQSLYARARNQPIERTRAQFSSFKKRWPESEYLPLLDKQVGLAERLAPGQPAPDIAITALDSSHLRLSDLKGKVVYLTFWSLKSKQSVGEMRADKKVKDVFNNKPVAFVYVCIDDDSVTANMLVQKLKIEGYYAWTSGSWYSREATAYGVQGLPAHYLIDKNGNFATQNPPSSQQKTEMIVAISKLL